MDKYDQIKPWSLSIEQAFTLLESDQIGLTQEDAESRLKTYGANTIEKHKKPTAIKLLIGQFKNPIIVILLIATLISAATGSYIDTIIIILIVIASAVLGFFQEYSASNAIAELSQRIQVKSLVLRNNETIEVHSDQIVPGDVLLLSAGSIISADALVIESHDLYVNQSALTGESLPSEKEITILDEMISVEERVNCVYMGTSVQSGSGRALVYSTGEATEYGHIAVKLESKIEETDFERGVRQFGFLLTELMLILTLTVFAINVLFNRPPIDSLLFSVALAVGITPQLLPAIISIMLSKGSKVMAKEGVIVRKLSSIENFGSMDILCTDKTGTLTQGIVIMDKAVSVDGQESQEVFRLAYINAKFQTGMDNPLDKAITTHGQIDISEVEKINEIPYDFTRKRLSVIVKDNNRTQMITKGAFNHIVAICQDEEKEAYNQLYQTWSAQGIRILGIATKTIETKENYTLLDENELHFAGFLLFFDPPKVGVEETIKKLSDHGIDLRIITGDNQLVAKHIAVEVGLEVNKVLTGSQMMNIPSSALWKAVQSTNVFAEVDPNQKAQIIIALQKLNHVVGYMGDGINDVPALSVADIAISVDSAVDVAKDSANFVLIEKSLDVLNRGIELGRMTFANTLKYINITVSANFGNMFSMAGASLFMSFLPLLPKQILLINFLSDFPALTISHDTVDEEILNKPQKWDIKFIRDFMFVFGIISSVFDYLTFGVLLIGFRADQTLFQSSWFVLSVFTELLILLVMRTRRPFYKSKPTPILLFSSIAVGLVTLLITYLPINHFFGLEPVRFDILIQLIVIVILYIFVTEIAKHYFFKLKNSQQH